MMNEFILPNNEGQILRIDQNLIGRIEDMPYYSSPAIQFVYESTASLSLGSYTWDDGPSSLTPDRPIAENVIYYIRGITLSADIDELDYSASITTTPQFYTYKDSDSRTVLFREPIIMAKYFDQFPYRFIWQAGKVDDQLFAGFTGVLVQVPSLIGKATITLKAIISAQEIIDDDFINLLKAKFARSEGVRGIDR